MPGRVFISCGQRDNERQIAQRVAALLIHVGLEPYLSLTIQTLADVMTIIRELDVPRVPLKVERAVDVHVTRPPPVGWPTSIRSGSHPKPRDPGTP